MNVIYIAHPYGGDPDNLEKIHDLINELTIDYPDDYVFISPVPLWDEAYRVMEYTPGMDKCLELLSRCDELWLAYNWHESPGCMIEYGYAKGAEMPIKFQNKNNRLQFEECCQ